MSLTERQVELEVAANFAEIHLAREGHNNPVGINYLEKLQLTTLPSLYGAMLGGVDFILMGAGIPRTIPGALDLMSKGEPAQLHIDVEGSLPGEEFKVVFDPRKFFGEPPPALKRPNFLAIVGSYVLAAALARKSNGAIQGFVVEGLSAGGHNAPPRGALHLNSNGEPVYGERDVPDIEKIKSLGLPFWLAGSYGTPGKLSEARALGAAGVQVGTPFAFCAESGIIPEIKSEVIRRCRAGNIRVMTDPYASPTGFPFKVVQLEKTLADATTYSERCRICDLGYLRHPYRKDDGSVGYRCPSEPVADFIKKGGTLEQTMGRKCLCNGLSATVGLAQKRPGSPLEVPIITAGYHLTELAQFLHPTTDTYTAAEVIQRILGNNG
jgi:NAD(P)H-dependent flavin oxidoreductase YrpB (nitropropane dioxygenase family)